MSVRKISKKKLREAIEPLLKKYPIEIVYLFGSKTQKNTNPHDIDIGILLSRKSKSPEVFNEEIEIETFLQKKLKLYEKIDVSVLNGKNALFINEVIKPQEILFVKDKHVKEDFEVANYYKVEEQLAIIHKLRHFRNMNNEKQRD